MTTLNDYRWSKLQSNPYRHRQEEWRAPQRRLLLFSSIIGGLLLLLAFSAMIRNRRDSFGCDAIHSLLSSVRKGHTPRWQQQQRSPTTTNNKTGGVVLFWHLAKTGGSTVRGNFASLFEKVDYRPLLKPQDWKRISIQIQQRLTSKSERILFVELHGQGTFPTNHWESILQEWRELADVHDKHFFVFTILREPTSHAISYYNFFHKSNKASAPLQHESMESHFQSNLTPNQQCTTLTQLPKRHWWSSLPQRVNAQTCTNVYSKLLQHMDWIGTTETLTNQTLPLLHTLLSMWTNELQEMPLFMNKNVAKSNDQRIRFDHLSETTKEALQEATCYDRALWEYSQVDYPIQQILQSYTT